MAQKTNSRQRISLDTETEILVKSKRRCCMCYFLFDIKTPKKGQIAHLNRNRTDSSFSNLVYLCLDHHDDFDSTTSQSKGYTPSEVREYRDRLYNEFNSRHVVNEELFDESSFLENIDSDRDLSPIFSNENYPYLLKPWKSLFPSETDPELFAFKSPNKFDGICRIEKISLESEQVVVICEDVEENPGISVTNAIESIALQLCKHYKVEPLNLILIQHHHKSFIGEEEWLLVKFDNKSPNSFFEGPTWISMKVEDWEALGLLPR